MQRVIACLIAGLVVTAGGLPVGTMWCQQQRDLMQAIDCVAVPQQLAMTQGTAVESACCAKHAPLQPEPADQPQDAAGACCTLFDSPAAVKPGLSDHMVPVVVMPTVWLPPPAVAPITAQRAVLLMPPATGPPPHLRSQRCVQLLI